MPVRLSLAALLLEGAAERVVRVVVHRVRARAPCGTPPPPPPSARSGSRRSRAPRGSTPCPARAASPSRARPSPARACPARDARGLSGRGCRSIRSLPQVREVLLYQVNRMRQVPRLPDLDARNREAGASIRCEDGRARTAGRQCPSKKRTSSGPSTRAARPQAGWPGRRRARARCGRRRLAPRPVRRIGGGSRRYAIAPGRAGLGDAWRSADVPG